MPPLRNAVHGADNDCAATLERTPGGHHGHQQMKVSDRISKLRDPIQIECLACGAKRVVTGITHAETGDCPYCHYLGWTYSDELDGSTRRLIMNGGLGVGPHRRPRPKPRRV
jgi:hypothetical protein